jgi:tetratricopeptide (TPR) repeat protein
LKYSLRRVCRIVRLSPAIVASLVSAGVVAPARGPRGALEFSFRDLAVLRGLSQARPTALRRGASRLRPAEGLRLVARGQRPVVLDPNGMAWDAESGQLLIDFDTEPAGAARVLVMNDGGPADASMLEQAIALEAIDADAAIRAYRQAILSDPRSEDAYLNLGALLQDRMGLESALAVYVEGAAQCPASALLRFNCGVAFQLLSVYQEAERWYQQALALDPTLADAHHNLAMIYLEIGEEQRAIRHHNEMRRLERR